MEPNFDPRAIIAQTIGGNSHENALALQATQSKGGARILVAEDDPINGCATLHHLTQLGFAVEVVEDGEQVLRAWSKGAFQIVLLDCQMPLLDGFETAKEIRRCEANGRHTLLIALTSLSSPADRERCFLSGMDDVLLKPIDRPQLAACLDHWLGRKEATQVTPQIAGTNEVDFEQQLIPLFLADAPLRLATIRQASASGDARGLEQAAHTLKSSSFLMGAHALAQGCERLESLGQQGEVAQIQDVELLEREFSSMPQKLQARLRSRPEPS